MTLPLNGLSAPIPAATGANFLILTPDDGGAAKFYGVVYGFPNVGDTRNNDVMRFGWNIAGGGGRVDSADAAFALEIESHYAPDTHRYMESHMAFTNLTGTLIRPISFRCDKTSGDTQSSMTFDAFGLVDRSTGAQFVKFQKGTVHLIANTALVFESNNTGVQSVNHAGSGYVTLIKLDGADVTQVGGGGPTNIGGAATFGGTVTVTGAVTMNSTLSISGALTLGGQAVTLGDPDSGGTGYRCLRVPN